MTSLYSPAPSISLTACLLLCVCLPRLLPAAAPVRPEGLVLAGKAEGGAKFRPEALEKPDTTWSQMTLLASFALTPDGGEKSIFTWQSTDKKQGFRLFAREDRTLVFEASFDWKNRRNNRPLQITVPLAPGARQARHQVLVRFTGPCLELRLDGVLVDEEWPVGAMAPPVNMAPTVQQDGIQWDELKLWQRALSDDELVALAGGAESISRHELELLGPERPVAQYWQPRGFNTGVGDCMPFADQGRFHLFYLIDRHGHASKWGLGAHQWAHVSSADLRTWEHHPLAVAITDQSEGSICTGSAFAHDGAVDAFYAIRSADGSPARLAASHSEDGIHFQKAEWSQTLTPPYSGPPARDPMVFREPGTGLFHMLVTTELLQPAFSRRGGCLAQLVSTDLRHWEQREPFVPGFTDQPECPDWFAWKGWYYLVFSNNGVARYRMAHAPLGPWLKPKSDTFDGPEARVLKTAAFGADRRIGAAFLSHAGAGYAGNLLLREILQQPDGTLATAFPPEVQPLHGASLPLTPLPHVVGVSGDASHLEIDSPTGFSVATFDRLPAAYRLTFRMKVKERTAALGVCVRGAGSYDSGHELRFEPEREKVGWRATDANTIQEHEGAAIYGVEGLDRAITVEAIVRPDLLDACIDGRRTIVTRGPAKQTGDRLFFFVQNGGATFENVRVEPLVEGN